MSMYVARCIYHVVQPAPLRSSPNSRLQGMVKQFPSKLVVTSGPRPHPQSGMSVRKRIDMPADMHVSFRAHRRILMHHADPDLYAQGGGPWTPAQALSGANA
jgi:hypothetical protein